MKCGNAIDQLRQSGGFWKEQLRRRLEGLVRHSKKIKHELKEMEQSELGEFAKHSQDMTEISVEQNI